MFTWWILTLIAVTLTPWLFGALVVYVLARRMGREQYGARRALLAALGMMLCLPLVNLLFGVAGWYFGDWRLATISPLLILILAFVWGRLTLKLPFLKSAGLGVAWLATTFVLSIGAILVLRFFACDPYVIPTGAMAPTFYGYHRDIVCPQCGHTFALNASAEADPAPGMLPVQTNGCTCPNCRYHITFDSLANQPPAIMGGDRVAFGTGLFGASTNPPARGDLVDFVYPEEFAKKGTRTIYVKRLVGLPGETVAIRDGRLYVRPVEQSPRPPEDAAAPEADLWQRQYLHAETVKDDSAQLQANGFVLVRKTPDQIVALRRLVYDNDHQAKDLQVTLPPRWAGEQWKEDGTGFQCPDSEKVQWLRYRHYLRDDPKTEAKYSQRPDALTDKPPARSLITNFEGYNSYEGSFGHVQHAENWVGELLLECAIDGKNMTGEMMLELSKGPDRFRAVFEPQQFRLLRVDGGKEHELHNQTWSFPQGPHRLRFANIDETLTVWIDNALLANGITYAPSAKHGPMAANDLEPASIGVKGMSLKVSHLKLWRDVYYTTAAHGSPTAPDHDGNVDLSEPATWAPVEERAAQRYYVQPGHYFVLGDNSSESSDSRSWGAVPSRLLLGKALLVYYPFERARRLP